jgi:hypothetical protein
MFSAASMTILRMSAGSELSQDLLPTTSASSKKCPVVEMYRVTSKSLAPRMLVKGSSPPSMTPVCMAL